MFKDEMLISVLQECIGRWSRWVGQPEPIIFGKFHGKALERRILKTIVTTGQGETFTLSMEAMTFDPLGSRSKVGSFGCCEKVAVSLIYKYQLKVS